MDIIEEMRRKPDAEILLDWIEEQAVMGGREASEDIWNAIAAYREGLEEQ